MGQVRKVQVHRLILPESVDEHMLEILARKQKEFNQYARPSDLADSVSDAKGVPEESIAKTIVKEERERLGLSANSGNVFIEEEF